MAAPNRVALLIERDIERLRQQPMASVINLVLNQENGTHTLTGILIGPDGSDYAGGHFRFTLTYPPAYPFKPPVFTFNTRICHPNIDSTSGHTSHELLTAEWNPNIALPTILGAMVELLARPNYEIPIEGDATVEKTPEMAREWTQKYAQPAP